MSEKKLIYERMSAVMAELKAIGKDKTNQIQRFKFRGIDDVYNHLNPIMARHKVFSTSEILETWHEDRKTAKAGTLIYRIFKMRYTFHTEDGSSVSTEVMGEAMDSGDKASNKAMSIAHKYAFFQIFAIPTENIDDPDAHIHQPAPAPEVYTGTAQQKKRLVEMLSKAKVPKDQMKIIADKCMNQPIADLQKIIKKEISSAK